MMLPDAPRRRAPCFARSLEVRRRKIGQDGINQARLSCEDIANEAAKIVKRPVTRANVLDIMTSLKLQSAIKRPESNDKLNELTSRVEALEAACKTAGIWPI